MRGIRTMLVALTTWVFPWPHRDERKAAIREARRAKLRARGELADAENDRAAIVRMAEENHFAERVARQIMGG